MPLATVDGTKRAKTVSAHYISSRDVRFICKLRLFVGIASNLHVNVFRNAFRISELRFSQTSIIVGLLESRRPFGATVYFCSTWVATAHHSSSLCFIENWCCSMSHETPYCTIRIQLHQQLAVHRLSANCLLCHVLTHEVNVCFY